ncbi:MAG: gamma carbonic anhydrase family protein [Planctomycetota bacterium]|nr:MAG: gamma carbonic anhydrase family protein [Planctomycetota bacterium]
MIKEDFSHFEKEPQFDSSVFIAESADVMGHVLIEKDVSIWFQCVIRGDINYISIGEGSNIQDGTVLHVADEFPCVIGKNVVVGHQATVHACEIGDNCLIGMKSTILNGAKIGSGSIIGSGAVVPMNAIIPANSLVLGIPGKVKRQVSMKEVEYTKHLANKYVRLKELYLNKN